MRRATGITRASRVDEDYDVDPTDSYGLSKVVGEKIARSFASRTGADIYALRIGVVIEPLTMSDFRRLWPTRSSRKRDAWSYIDVRDLAQIVDLCLEKDGLGFQVFNASNDEIIANEPATSFLARHRAADADGARTRGVRGPDVQSKGARNFGLPRAAQLAKIRSQSLMTVSWRPMAVTTRRV